MQLLLMLVAAVVECLTYVVFSLLEMDRLSVCAVTAPVFQAQNHLVALLVAVAIAVAVDAITYEGSLASA